MSSRRQQTPPEDKYVSHEDAARGIASLQKRIAELRALDPKGEDGKWDTESDAVLAKIDSTLSNLFGHGTPQYSRWRVGSLYNSTEPVTLGGGWDGGHNYRADHTPARTNGINNAIALLAACIEMLEETYGPSPQAPPVTVPAADRVVRLDHNNPQVVSVNSGLEKIKAELVGNNSYPDPEEKARLQAEVMAAIEIMRAPTARSSVAETLLVKLLQKLAEKFVDHIIGILATALIITVCAYFGITLPG